METRMLKARTRRADGDDSPQGKAAEAAGRGAQQRQQYPSSMDIRAAQTPNPPREADRSKRGKDDVMN